MTLTHYGNWCGPGWSAGQHKDAADLTTEDERVPAINELDQLCKEHDIALRDAETREQVEHINQLFIQRAKDQGITGNVMAQLVSLWDQENQITQQQQVRHY